MSELANDADASLDPSTPFCARTYFEGLRRAGCEPYAVIRDEEKGWGSSFANTEANRRAETFGLWAARMDADQAMVRAYVDSVLSGHRVESLAVIPLGL